MQSKVTDRLGTCNLFNLRSASLRVFGLLPNPRRGAFTVVDTAVEKFLQKFLDPDPDQDYHQNLTERSLYYVQPFHRIS